MPTKKQKDSTSRKHRVLPFLLALGGLFALALILTGGGFIFAATQEQRDSFCASCHTQPESTFHERSLAPQAVDLASAHTPKNTRCIDCHSGVGVTGRMGAELQGAHNALAWYTGTAVQPAKLTAPVRDESCLKCHPQVTVGRGRNNHFHAFLAQWQAVDPNAGTCVSCHNGHVTGGDAQISFQNETATIAVCDACHGVIGERD